MSLRNRQSTASTTPNASTEPTVAPVNPQSTASNASITPADIELLLQYDHNHLGDAGNKHPDHYKSRLSPFRYKVRALLLPYLRHETPLIFKLQQAIRHPVLDFYFAWTANLASHTFYVLILPIPLWFGGGKLVRDLVYVLGFGIYITGYLKDFFCLPRPRSPPVHRITMSSYTTQEYGFPLSHSANATAVTLVVLFAILNADWAQGRALWVLLSLLALYYVLLIFGRVYCGMHGLLDIVSGGTVGVACFLFRHFVGELWDQLLLADLMKLPLPIVLLVVFAAYLFLVHIHAEPVDDCPCFDDLVAFIGVLIGLEFSHILSYRFSSAADPMRIPYDWERLGLLLSVLRVGVGVILVLAWKSVSKRVVFTVLPPIYKFVGIYLPRRNFIPTAYTEKLTRQIRLASLVTDQIDLLLKVNNDVGPQGEIDLYEMLDYQNGNEPEERVKFTSGAFKPRYDVEIVGRLIVYAGITVSAFWGFCAVTRVVGLA